MTREEKREYDRKWYHRNKERIGPKKNKDQKNRSDKRRKLVLDYLRLNPCVDCGEKDPIVLEFDHKYPNSKLNNIASLITGQYSEKVILDEIAKCDVRCANCHRRKTAKQFSWYKNIESVL